MVIHLLNTHLTIRIAFSLTLNTISFEYSTLEWFVTSTCIAITVGLLPSFIQLFVINLLLITGVAHSHLHIFFHFLYQLFICHVKTSIFIYLQRLSYIIILYRRFDFFATFFICYIIYCRLFIILSWGKGGIKYKIVDYFEQGKRVGLL